MVVLSEPLPYDKIVKELNKNDKIALISCNTCVRFCGSGGVKYMNDLASKLRKDGYTVTDVIPTTALCINDYVQNARVSDGVTVVLVSACDAGWTSASQRWKGIKVIPTVDTFGIVVGDRRAGVIKLMIPYEKHRDMIGQEWHLITGERMKESKIPVPIQEGH